MTLSLLATVLFATGDVKSQGEPPRPRSAASLAAESFWKEWAAAHRYNFATSKDERVVVMLPQERSRQERALDLMERALARFDEILPPPTPPTQASPSSAASEAPWSWGAPNHRLDSDAIVFGLFRKPADYADALDLVSQTFTYLAPWAEKAKNDPGCLLLQPLFGGCVDNVPGMQEWNPENELVHRVAQLAMFRRFGHQPVWVGLGVGWNVEWDVLKTIYCFPWRNSFVSVHEHGAWEADLRRTFGKRKKEPLSMDELASCRRTQFDAGQAAEAWGTIRFLAENYPKQLPELLADLQATREKAGRKADPGGSQAWSSWSIPADFELSAEQQKALFDQHLAPDALEQASTYFREGKDWKKVYAKQKK
jgi:hypothetical protein